MAQGIRIPFISDVTQFLRGTKDVEDALDDVEDALDDVAKEGDQAADKLEASFRDASRAIRTSTDDAADGIKGGKIKDVGSEVGSEFAQNFGEAVRGGDPAGAVVETVTSLGPAFGLAGVALAAGAGVVLSFIKGGQEKAAEVKALAGSLFDAFRDGILEASEKENLLIEALGVDNAQEAYSKVGELARTLGLDAATLTEQIIGGTLDAEALEARVTAVDDLMQGRIKGRAGQGGNTIPQQLKDSKSAAEELLGVQDKVTQSARDYRDALNVANEIARNKLIPALRDVPAVPVGPASSGYNFPRTNGRP